MHEVVLRFRIPSIKLREPLTQIHKLEPTKPWRKLTHQLKALRPENPGKLLTIHGGFSLTLCKELMDLTVHLG